MGETKLKLNLSDPTGEWSETYDAPVEQEHEKWAQIIVNNFNESVPQGDFHRTLISVEVITQGEILPASGHNWQPVTGGKVGAYKCETCTITGIRKATEWPPKPDKPFRGRFFASCDIVREYMPLSAEQRTIYRNRKTGGERWRKNMRSRRGW